MDRFKVSALAVGVFLFFAVGVYGQRQRPTGERSRDAGSAVSTPVVSTPVEPDSPATDSTVTASPQASSQAASQAIVPRLIKFSGLLRDVIGKPLSGPLDVTFALYNTEAGGDPLWYETQTVQADQLGHYTALLGAMHTDGLPVELFTSGEVRWLGIQVGHEQEQQPRVLLVSVPYALKAGDAETLGGKPASAYMLSDLQSAGTSGSGAPSKAGTVQPGGSGKKPIKNGAGPLIVTPCSSVTGDGLALANQIALYTSACALGEDAALVDVGGNIGIGTTNPQALLHIQDGSLRLSRGGSWPLILDQSLGSIFTITNGGNKQLAFDSNGNLGLGTTSPLARVHIQDGSLVLRDGGAWPLTMEQGFGSVFTITNGGNKQLAFDSNGSLILRNGGAWPLTMEQSLGSIFTITNGGAPRFAIDSLGNVGIGTTAPRSPLEVDGTNTSQIISVTQSGNGSGIVASTASTTAFSGAIVGTATGSGQVAGVIGIYSGAAQGAGIFGEATTASGSAGFFRNTAGGTALNVDNSTGTASLFQVDSSGTVTVGDVLSSAYIKVDGATIVIHGPSSIIGNSSINGNLSITGNLSVSGVITAGTKDFKIDDPVDPGGKYLYHASIESSQMMNLYTGNVILDASGKAVVKLPHWFEALNTDFRYQLTAIGRPGSNLYIAQEVQNNTFKIAGGTPGLKVSWQVTGVRHDTWAKSHPLNVEEEKTEAERLQSAPSQVEGGSN